MTIIFWLPVLASVGFGAIAPSWSRRLPPALATWLLSIGGLLAAAASSTAVALVAFRVLAQTALFRATGHWSGAVLRARDPIGLPAAIAAVVASVLVLVAGSWALYLRIRATVAAYRLAAEVGGTELCVLDSADPCAIAVPGRRRGRIVVTSGLLRRLDGPQRAALLGHERAHLAHRHHLHQSAVTVACAVNPALCRLPAASRLSCERWADEVAAADAGRATIAKALLLAAVADRPNMPAAVLAAGNLGILDRVAALAQPAPRARPLRVMVLIGLVATAVYTAIFAVHRTEHLFELAQAGWRAGYH